MIIKLSRRQFVNLSIRRVVSRIVCKFQSSSSFFSAHYSKSQIFVQKFNFDKKPNIFTSFSPKIFLTIFLVKSKLSTAKKSKITTFSRVFQPKKFTIFSGNQSWIFGQKMKILNSVTNDFHFLLFLAFLSSHPITSRSARIPGKISPWIILPWNWKICQNSNSGSPKWIPRSGLLFASMARRRWRQPLIHRVFHQLVMFNFDSLHDNFDH